MRLVLTFACLAILFSSCKTLINNEFDYHASISPEEISIDIEQLKSHLIKKHYDFNWEGRKDLLWQELELINNVDSPISLDSFEQRISKVINTLDDGHSKVFRQIKHEIPEDSFTFEKFSDEYYHLKIPNFSESKKMRTALKGFKLSFEKNPTKNLIIDFRSNLGGTMQNVNFFLSYFLPSHTAIYDKMEFKPVSLLNRYTVLLQKLTTQRKKVKYTKEKKLDGTPDIYLLIDNQIMSASMIAAYHLQKNGATVIGSTPNSLFNSFGNAKGYKLSNSKLVYALARARVFLTDQRPTRTEDMMIPDYIPESDLDIKQAVDYINQFILE